MMASSSQVDTRQPSDQEAQTGPIVVNRRTGVSSFKMSEEFLGTVYLEPG